MKINIHQQIYKWNIFDQQMKVIKNLNYEFYNPKFFVEEFEKTKKEKKYFNYY